VPSIIVQAISAKVETLSTFVDLKICVAAYDENPNGQGYQDVLNMIENMVPALTSYGQKGIDESYVIVLPMEWHLIEADMMSHFAGEIVTKWELPSARPLPDDEMFGIIPAEKIDLRATHSGDFSPLFTEDDSDVPPPDGPPIELPPPDVFMLTFRPADVNIQQNRFQISNHGLVDGYVIRFALGATGNELPSPLTESAYYFVVNSTATAFQVSLAAGGAVIALGSIGIGDNEIWRKI